MEKPTEAGRKIREDQNFSAAKEYGILDCVKDITDLHARDKLGQRRKSVFLYYVSLSISCVSISLFLSLSLSLFLSLSFLSLPY